VTVTVSMVTANGITACHGFDPRSQGGKVQDHFQVVSVHELMLLAGKFDDKVLVAVTVNCVRDW
jgi:hypothetical protein